VARIPTHLFTWLGYRKAFTNSWGRGVRKAVGGWYARKELGQLVYHLVKYRQREGWSHSDVLRLAHPTVTGDANTALGWAAGKVVFSKETGTFSRMQKTGSAEKKDVKYVPGDEVKLPETLRLIEGFEMAQTADEKELVKLIGEYRLPWEAIPTEKLGSPKVWGALLPEMPITALVRNLGRMTANGLLTKGSEAVKVVVEKLANKEALAKSRLHPIQALSALKVYTDGHGARGKLTWTPVSKIGDALDELFYAAFGNVQPTGKRICIGLDVSSSMGGGEIAGVPGLTPAIAAAAMAMVVARVEKDHEILAFAETLKELDVTPRMRLDDVLKKTQDVNFGGTDCALPMIWASGKTVKTRGMGYSSIFGGGRENPTIIGTGKVIPFDAFLILTDSESWAGEEHPGQALKEYRKASGIDAKHIVVGMTATEYSVGDPSDAGTLNVAGFDGAAPELISGFIRGEF
jgi:60 kDa SS-A/Ro ribonucleoprotein